MAENNAITTLLSLGNDAMDNMYDVYYSPAGGEAEMHLTGRLQGFTPPAWNPGTHQVSYHGQTITLPSTKLEFNRELQLTFRLDANYQWFDYWRSLSIYAGNGATGGVANAPVNTGVLKVVTIADDMVGAADLSKPAIYGEVIKSNEEKSRGTSKGPNSHDTEQWIFYDCWVHSITEPAFTTNGGAEQTFQVKLYFGRCSYPYANTPAEMSGTQD